MRRALSFLTPVGGASDPSPEAVAWFPAVGLMIGLCLGGIWWAVSGEWAALVAAGVVVVADLALTGMLHFDGLVDSADGLFSHGDRDMRLAVMRDPRAGAFGVCAAAAALVLRWGALASIKPSVILLGGLWCASRTWMAACTRLVPYARPAGLASAFMGPAGASWLASALGLVASTALLVAWKPAQGPVVLASGTVAAGAVVLLARRRIGGFTGDVLGAAGVVGETIGLVAAAARW